MADAMSRVTSGRKIGVFCMQHGPGTENAYGGVAQAYSESVPILVMPRASRGASPGSTATSTPSLNMQNITKSAEPVTSAKELPNIMRRAFQRLRSGRGGPVLVEVPTDVWAEECRSLGLRVPEGDTYRPRPGRRARGRQDADRRQAPGDLRRPGRALGRGLGRAQGARRAAGHPGDHQPRRQERVPRDPSAVARLGRPRHPADGAHTSSTSPT